MKPAGKAVDWLAGQQCEDGGFAAFRAEPGKACDKKTVVDSNSTAAAVQALVAVGGRDGEVAKGVAWLKKQPERGRRLGIQPRRRQRRQLHLRRAGGARRRRREPADVTSGPVSPASTRSPPSRSLLRGQERWRPRLPARQEGELTANADATAAGVLGALGTAGLCAPARREADAYTCETTARAPRASRTTAPSTCRTSSPPTVPEVPAGRRRGPARLRQHTRTRSPPSRPPRALKHTKDPYASAGEERAGVGRAERSRRSYAQLVFAAHATGNDPRDFGGTDS